MTNLPVTAGVPNIMTGTQAAPRIPEKNGDNNFSDYLSSQNNAESPEKDEVRADAKQTNVRVDSRADKVKASAQGIKEKPEEISDEDLEEMAKVMAEITACELGITVEELNVILEENDMSALDLCTTEGLKDVLMAVSGEDATAFITDDKMFSDLQNLSNALEGVMQEFAEESGMEVTDVKDAFENALQAAEVPDKPVEKEEEPVSGVKLNIESAKPEEANVAKAPKETTGTDENADEEKSEAKTDETPKFHPAAHVEAEKNVQTKEVSEAEVPVSYRETETERILSQITERIKITKGEDLTEMEMQLHPASLGNLRVHLSSRQGVLTAQFTAQSETVREAIQSQMVQLTESFKEQGITVEAIEVTVSSHKFEQSYEQAQSDSKEAERQAARSVKVRRLNLNTLGEEEELTDEENLAKEMMEANGGTVDYMA